jgi:hydroxypyruvate reductase
MKRSADQLRRDALRIWQSGLKAVLSDCLVREAVRVDGERLLIADLSPIDVTRIRRIEVVGAGKAGAGMASGLEDALGDELLSGKNVSGWVNVPADCLRPLKRIHLHAARPAGVNEPTEAGVVGSEEILRRVSALGPDDLCLCLISGGGSALLPAPVEGVTLADKQEVTRRLSAAGANIEQLNVVRKQLSHIKGGGLARACRAGRLVTLIISDVLGDPLDVIASGPTVPDRSTPEQALAVMKQFLAREAGVSPALLRCLEQRQPRAHGAAPVCRVDNLVIGNNARAVDAAGAEAVALGYTPAIHVATSLEGQAEDVGRHHAQMARRMLAHPGPDCLVTGGEPVVRLVDESRRGKGGRNQQLVLAALIALADTGLQGSIVLSGGTDGEDGPTDAAGAFADAQVSQAAQAAGLDPADYLARNDAYRFFEPLGGLIKSGPTHTNVCDLRVVLVERADRPGAGNKVGP